MHNMLHILVEVLEGQCHSPSQQTADFINNGNVFQEERCGVCPVSPQSSVRFLLQFTRANDHISLVWISQ